MFLLLVGFILGVIAVVAVEAAGLLYLLRRLIQKTTTSTSSFKSNQSLDPQQSLNFASNKQGFVWVLESEKIPKNWHLELKRKKDCLDVFPVRKYAKIKDGALFLMNSDGSRTTILLKDCIIEAVSATSQSSRKWAKRFPIKVESKRSVICNESKTVYIYLDTSWEKESWCKTLRLASCDDQKRRDWFTKLNKEFQHYLGSLNAGYPSFMKPSAGLNAELIDREDRADSSSSKVRLFWKKLARKASKPYLDPKALIPSLGIEERKPNEKFHPSRDSATSTLKSGAMKVPNSSGDENVESLSATSHSRSQSPISDADSRDKSIIDEGTLCFNLLMSRLFYDAKSNTGMKSSIQARIQRTLSNMRTLSYVGEIICTDVHIGNVPPYIHGMRVLPTDLTEVCAFEVDVEYAGGVVLLVETRLEVCELDTQKGIENVNSESSTVADVSSDLIEGLEYLRKQLDVTQGSIDGQDQKNEGDLKLDGSQNCKSNVVASTSVSRWKGLLNSVAKQVSQVPLSLSIRVVSLRGTLQLHIKPPPSDQLWFGFTSMPDIEFDLESGIGEHKITGGHIALLLISRFKTAIRETMVLPNCESVCIPWMLAEKDDWAPRNIAPFIWRTPEAGIDHSTSVATSSSVISEANTKTEPARGALIDGSDSKHKKPKTVDLIDQPNTLTSISSMPTASRPSSSLLNIKSLQELQTPLLTNEEATESCLQNSEEIVQSPPSRSLALLETQNYGSEDDDSKPRKMGRKARMLDLGKKMGEKLEEKRRHIEEKSRLIVEKMRENKKS